MLSQCAFHRITSGTLGPDLSEVETGEEMRLFYFAAWTDSECLLGCNHRHETVISATACISHVGGYVVAVENAELRALTGKEEAQFQHAMYGRDIHGQNAGEVLPGVTGEIAPEAI
jgi:hypothetical protein